MSIRLTGCLALAASLGACSTIQVAETGEEVPASAIVPYEQWPAEFAGNTVLIETDSGWVNAVNLAPDGTMTIIPELGAAAVKGYWGTKGDGLCVSDAPRGETLNVRLLSEDEEVLVERGG